MLKPLSDLCQGLDTCRSINRYGMEVIAHGSSQEQLGQIMKLGKLKEK